jgi:transposase
MAWRAVTEKQWKVIAAPLPQRTPKPRGGRPRLSDRQCFEGILWILWTGAPWSELPERYGSKSAVHSRLSAWAASGVRFNLWRAFLDHRNEARMAPQLWSLLRAPFCHRQRGTARIPRDPHMIRAV